MNSSVLHKDDVVAVVLAGGESRRMGREKAFESIPGGGISYAGQRLIDVVIQRIRLQCSQVIIIANGDPSRFGSLQDIIRSDVITGGHGPLAGVHSGLVWSKKLYPDSKAILTIPIDTPFFPDDLLDRLLIASRGGNHISYATNFYQNKLQEHPVCALWPMDITDDLSHFMHSSINKKMLTFMSSQGCTRAMFPAALRVTENPFFNLNTQDDLLISGLWSGGSNHCGCKKIFGITGWKNSGKTRVMRGVISTLGNMGLRIAAMKRASDAFECDIEGTDSWHFRQAGASEVLVTSSVRWAIIREKEMASQETVHQATERLGKDHDMILVEGWKMSSISKIEVFRKENGGKLMMERVPGIVAIATDCDSSFEEYGYNRRFDIDDYLGISRILLQLACES